MGKPIEITRLDFSPVELRELAAHERDGAIVRRLLAIAMILEGASREEAARLNGMDRQTLRDWVHRYNVGGVEGLRSHVIPGRPPALNGDQMEEFRIMVLEGPDPERNLVYRWRCADLRDEIALRWSVAPSRKSPPSATAPCSTLSKPLYALRSRIECCVGHHKEQRRIATRYDKTATSFLGFVLLGCIRLWIRFVRRSSFEMRASSLKD